MKLKKKKKKKKKQEKKKKKNEITSLFFMYFYHPRLSSIINSLSVNLDDFHPFFKKIQNTGNLYGGF